MVLVVDKDPNKRPWNADLKDNILNSGEPGAEFFIHDCNSSSVNFWSPFPYNLSLKAMKEALYALSFEHDPHIAVNNYKVILVIQEIQFLKFHT